MDGNQESSSSYSSEYITCTEGLHIFTTAVLLTNTSYT